MILFYYGIILSLDVLNLCCFQVPTQLHINQLNFFNYHTVRKKGTMVPIITLSEKKVP